MLYQKLLIGKNPYVVAVGPAKPFPLHCHPEIELTYCLNGEYSVLLGGKSLDMKDGDLLIIPPMIPHEFPKNSKNGYHLIIELGPGFLGNFFDHFARMHQTPTVLSLKIDTPAYAALAELLEDTAQLRRKPSEFSGLLLWSNLYRLSGLLLELLAQNSPATPIRNDTIKIEQALEIIYSHYTEPLELETVAQTCGYSKSGFCRVFKSVTGDTFHALLNRHRIEIACMYLKNGQNSIEQIATDVGFSDAKSFCRVFKNQMGCSPGNFRKQFDSK